MTFLKVLYARVVGRGGKSKLLAGIFYLIVSLDVFFNGCLSIILMLMILFCSIVAQCQLPLHHIPVGGRGQSKGLPAN